MSTTTRGIGRQYWVALRAMIVLTVALGIAYPLLITGIGQLTMPGRANGSVVRLDGHVVGSSLIGQSFTTKKGDALAQWFQSRPSAAGDGYDANASSGSNLGPDSPTLLKEVHQRQAAIAKADGVDVSEIPADAVTASGSGLDPDISPAYAKLQIHAVAAARGLSESSVAALVDEHTSGRALGFIGEPTVDVLRLNLALAKMDPSGN